MSKYGKNPLKIFPETSGKIGMEFGMYHRGLKSIISCSNDNPWLTLTDFGESQILQLGLLCGKM